MSSPKFPEPPPSMPETSQEVIDRKIKRLKEHAGDWVSMDIDARIEILKRTIETMKKAAPKWVAAVCQAKGIDPESQQAGEAWLSGPATTIRNIRLFIDTLEANGQPRPPKTWKRTNGQYVAKVFPSTIWDRIMFGGHEAEIWIENGKPPTQGKIYRDKTYGVAKEGAVSLVLGAGNISSIGPMDALHKLVVEDEVVLLKTNPVNAYVGPFLEEGFAPLIQAGFFEVVHGGAGVGKYLCEHKDIASIHITGSDATHDAIVWGGTKKEQTKRKKANDPKLKIPISSELGCVTPVMVVPGPFSDFEMTYHARHVASMISHNGSFNCNAAKVLVTAKGWPQEQEFLRRVRAEICRTPPRKAYYPGAQDRYKGFLEAYPNAEVLGVGGEDIVPWTLIPDVAPEQGEYALTNEAFCGVLAHVSIDAKDAPDFLEAVVPFVNEKVWGTLSCSLILHSESEKRYPEAVDQAIAGLKYGGIGINVWPGLIYGLVTTTWGAHPSHTLDNIGSGIGVVHNSFLFDHPEKSVLRAPFIIRPTPPWFHDHGKLAGLGEALVDFESAPSLTKLPKLVGNALLG